MTDVYQRLVRVIRWSPRELRCELGCGHPVYVRFGEPRTQRMFCLECTALAEQTASDAAARPVKL